ncbi:hypothetical protein [Bradyrhizobium sp. CSS354]|uniref:hypothetical protein n=1 Tax=Bradyrhizobium sp. CSS354 TaxID=2699172 RepID=UPI0023B06F17|nr:hypothetical protein [Bradyrhizobium sp. CSS354]MDE5461150.1 hypothetical protein [Bradyrhizobium sp. CSS354]
MKIIRGKPAKGKPPKIICTGCGARAREAGVAVDDAAIGRGSDVASMMIEEDDMQPLCEACLAALERAEIASTRERMQ